jgi:hypothetical protein
MGNREAFLILRIRTVYEYEPVPTISQEASTQLALRPLNGVSYVASTKPAMHIGERQAWELPNHNWQRKRSRSGKVARK